MSMVPNNDTMVPNSGPGTGGGSGGGRTLLATATTFFVRTTGNDSNNGLTSGTAWLTLQHAIIAIAGKYDFAGFLVTLDVGAGTFAGFGVHTFVGGGVFLLQGAGVGVTFITDGPADGLYNGGECISTYVSQGVDTTIYVEGVTMQSASSNILGLYQPGILQFGFPIPYGTGSIALVGTSGQFMVNIGANLINFGDTENSAGSVTLSGTCLGYVQCSGLSEIFLESTYTISGTPTWTEAFIELFEGAVANTFPIFSGASHGRRFNGVTGAIFDTGGNGINFYPGDVAGTLDSSSSYDGVQGIVDTYANILSAPSSPGQRAFATDLGIVLVADGTTWWVDSGFYTQQPSNSDIGEFVYSNRLGYGKTYVTDKELANCTVGYGSDPGKEGEIRQDPVNHLFSIFQNGVWQNIPVGVNLRIAAMTPYGFSLEQNPVGQWIQVYSGDSETLGLNGVPLTEGYTVSMGAYPPLQQVDGGTF